MSATLAPFGLRPIYNMVGGVRPRAYIGGISAAYNASLYRGSAIKLATTGVIQIAANAADMSGVFAGCEYTDSQGRRQYVPYWPASTTSTDRVAWVWDEPGTIFEAQAEGSLAQTAIGDQADFSVASGYAVGDGNTTTGLSTCALSTTLAGAGNQGMLRIVDRSLRVDNDWGDTYTIVQVMLARHQYVSNKVAI